MYYHWHEQLELYLKLDFKKFCCSLKDIYINNYHTRDQTPDPNKKRPVIVNMDGGVEGSVSAAKVSRSSLSLDPMLYK
jgi:hypothetical protein